MEELSNRFPDLVTMILENVDDESLVNVKESSREMSELIANKRFYWIRILKTYYQNFLEFSKLWRMVIEKTPVEIVEKLAVAVEMFFSKRTWSDCLWPELGKGTIHPGLRLLPSGKFILVLDRSHHFL